ncbi:MAG: helix-turn-helix domain-containing protein [Allomuricauda sp.]
MLNLPSGEYFGNSLKTAENNLLKLCITTHNEQTNIEKHYHENPYLSVLYSGSYIEEGDGKTQHISAGEALFRPKGYEHQNYFHETEGICFNIEFKPDWYEVESGYIENQKLSLQKFKASRYPVIYKSLLNLKRGEKTDLVFEQIYHWYSDFVTSKDVKQNIKWVKDVITILNDEIDQFHSLGDLAGAVNVHPVYLSRAFKKYQGCTLSEFQIRLKIERALGLLLSSSKCISAISFETGFYDDSHFIRSFKSIYGVPPYKFRSILRG